MLGSQKVTNRTVADNDATNVLCTDEILEPVRAHDYIVVRKTAPTQENDRAFASIHFQKGPVKENGVNGCQHIDILDILIDRLEYFQEGEFACDENAGQLEYLRQARALDIERTKRRKAAGTEGTNQGN